MFSGAQFGVYFLYAHEPLSSRKARQGQEKEVFDIPPSGCEKIVSKMSGAPKIWWNPRCFWVVRTIF